MEQLSPLNSDWHWSIEVHQRETAEVVFIM
jgi:hypothetical protein